MTGITPLPSNRPALMTTGSATNADVATAPTTESFQPSRLDRDSFLKLLVAQLKFQNPADPMDPTNLLGQTAQLTMVDKLNELIDIQQRSSPLSNATVAASMIGRHITWPEGSGVVNSVRLADSGMEAVVDGVTVRFDEIVEVRAADGPASTDGSGAGVWAPVEGADSADVDGSRPVTTLEDSLTDSPVDPGGPDAAADSPIPL